MLVPDMVKMISEKLKVFTSTKLPIPTCHILRSFVCKHLILTQTNSRVVFQYVFQPSCRENRPICENALEILGLFVGSACLWESTLFVSLTYVE